MARVGIIAEFNPLHTGHCFLLNAARRLGTVTAVLSGNFVQRGDTAIAEKRVRARAALLCGADIVLEMPVCYSMSSAQSFALHGVSALKAAGCDTVMFGSECGDINMLMAAADILSSDVYKENLKKHLKTGMTFAAARERAADIGGGLLSGANNNLAIEYITAAKSIGADFKFITVKRQGAQHDSNTASDGYVSASLLRKQLLAGNAEFCREYIPENVISLFLSDGIADIKRIETAVLAVLRAKTAEELKNLPDLSEGIENKLFSAIRVATSLEELYNTVKVKRYTHARIRRLALSAFLDIDSTFFMKAPPYVRVLGFSKKGEEQLKGQIGRCDPPLVMRAEEIKALGGDALKLFETECRATDIYSLASAGVLPCGLEYTAKLIKTE